MLAVVVKSSTHIISPSSLTVTMEEFVALESEDITDSALLSNSVSNNEVQEGNGLDGDSRTEKLVRFPLTRIKTLVKTDPDVHLCSQEALFLITKATVSLLCHFWLLISKDSYVFPHYRSYLWNALRKKLITSQLNPRRKLCRNGT